MLNYQELLELIRLWNNQQKGENEEKIYDTSVAELVGVGTFGRSRYKRDLFRLRRQLHFCLQVTRYQQILKINFYLYFLIVLSIIYCFKNHFGWICYLLID